MITIKDVKRKGSLMLLTIEDDGTPPISFNLEIDAEISEKELWSHIDSHYTRLIEVETPLVADEELEKKWKGKTQKET